MTLPTAMVVGPMKAGTTWIHEYFLARGDVCLPRQVKETFYFDRYFSKGPKWYSMHFDHYDNRTHRQVIEVAPSLFHSDAAPGRIRETLGEIPIVFTLRDPVRRTWSHYQHLRRYGYTRAPLRDAAREYPALLTASRYDERIALWRDALPNAPMTNLWLEDLHQTPMEYVSRLCEFAGLDYRDASQYDLSAANAATEAPSFQLARIGRNVANMLRWAGLYGVVNSAKAMGLKALFFGDAGRRPASLQPSQDDLAWIREQIG